MGNRTSLIFGDYCEFEANNCLPVTWLSLFASHELLVEIRHGDLEESEGEEYEAALYQTSQANALERVEQAVISLKGRTPAWAFLRPLEIIRDELYLCSSTATIELDATQFWAISEAFQKNIAEAANAFQEMKAGFSGNEEHDISLLDRLVSSYNPGSISSIANMDPESRMFIMVGTYWGDPVREDLYSSDYFSEGYWRAGL